MRERVRVDVGHPFTASSSSLLPMNPLLTLLFSSCFSLLYSLPICFVCIVLPFSFPSFFSLYPSFFPPSLFFLYPSLFPLFFFAPLLSFLCLSLSLSFFIVGIIARHSD
ncbi:MAG: hypothetical protein JOS17DRAFT_54660 [Linnemannia elongata]|nr:MAG: hypothetical protein JOS17DRAFT_54660 [Linnemannia elongata]